jgi:hypothetical protein
MQLVYFVCADNTTVILPIVVLVQNYVTSFEVITRIKGV